MIKDVDYIIDILKKFTTNDEVKGEIGEQDAAAGGGGATGQNATNNTNKRGKNWNEYVTTKRGHANPLGLSSEKWASGVVRGPANGTFTT